MLLEYRMSSTYLIIFTRIRISENWKTHQHYLLFYNTFLASIGAPYNCLLNKPHRTGVVVHSLTQNTPGSFVYLDLMKPRQKYIFSSSLKSLTPSTKRSYMVIIRDKSGQMEKYFTTLDLPERRWSPFQTAAFFGVRPHQVVIIWPDKLLWILKAELSASWEGFPYNHHDWGEVSLTEGF